MGVFWVLLFVFFLVFALGLVAWWLTIGRYDTLTERQRAARWELIVKGAGGLAVVVGGIMALGQYLDQRERELERQVIEQAQKTREFNLQIYGRSTDVNQARQVLLNEAADLGATLATLDDLRGDDGRIAQQRFERLYHGQLMLYENVAISNAMIDFRDALLKWQRTGLKPTKLVPEERTHSTELPENRKNSDFMRRLSIRLSQACANEIARLETSK